MESVVENAEPIVLLPIIGDPRGKLYDKPKRKRGKRNRRMFFTKIKRHWPKKPSIRKVRVPAEPLGDFIGFPVESPYHFQGFRDDCIAYSEFKSAYANVLLDAPVPEEHSLQVISIPMSSDLTAPSIYHFTVQRMLPHPIRALSLFDGISTGLHVLRDKLGMKVDEYFSSEVDGDALIVQRSRYFGQMTCLGDVKNVTSEMLECLGRIDLLLGGSPCDQLSRVNPYRLGLHDPASSGNLFFEYVRVRNFLHNKAELRREPFFWFFENTAHMDKNTRSDMEIALGCKPVVCCSSFFLPVTRKRLFFGNIPLMEETSKKLSRHKQPQSLQSIVGPWRKAVVESVPTITTKSSSQLEVHRAFTVTAAGVPTKLTINDFEVLLGFPKSYTDEGSLPLNRRMKLLGKAWCVPVVTELLRPLSDMFAINQVKDIPNPAPREFHLDL